MIVNHWIMEFGFSVSEKSFRDYLDNFDNDEHTGTYFGYICNRLPGYDSTMSIGVDVVLRGKDRPEVIPNRDYMNHLFVKDYYEGINNQLANSKLELTRK
jgi:hypothetical protein